MKTNSQDKTIRKYLTRLSKADDPTSEYKVISDGLTNVLSSAWHIDLVIFARTSNHFTVFYKINGCDIVMRH